MLRVMAVADSRKQLFRPWDQEPPQPPPPQPPPSATPLPSPIYTLNLWTSLFLNSTKTEYAPPAASMDPFYLCRPRAISHSSSLFAHHHHHQTTFLPAPTSSASLGVPFADTSAALAASTATVKPRRQRPKRFRCPHCQIAFSNNGQLKGHIRTHTGKSTTFSCLFVRTSCAIRC